MEPNLQVNAVKKGLVHKLNLNSPKNNVVYIIAAVLVVAGGVASGWLISGSGSLKLGGSQQAAPGAEANPNEAGISDESTFSDTAEGTLEKGALNGEGTHTLKRNSGANKDVALTSTVIDLDTYVGKKVQVWGQTLSAQKVAWLMDVGKLKVIQ